MQTSDTQTVCVVGSHPLVLQNIERALSKGRFRSSSQRIDPSPAGIVDAPPRAAMYVIDGQLPRSTAEGVVSVIAGQHPRSRIVVVGERFRETEAFALLRLGVKGLVTYDDLERTLPVALDAVRRGGLWVPRLLLSRFLDEMVGRSPRSVAASSAAVSTREREVLEWVLQGDSNKEIAERLHISERTVKFHVSNLLAKFELRSRQDLIRHCLSHVPRS